MGLTNFKIPNLRQYRAIKSDKSPSVKSLKKEKYFDVKTERFIVDSDDITKSEIERLFLTPDIGVMHQHRAHMLEDKFKFDNFYQFRTPSQIRLESSTHGDHPIILRDLMDSGKELRYMGENRKSNRGFTIEFIRGGEGAFERIKTDFIRLETFGFKTPEGIRSLGKQAALQFLNPRHETRVINPAYAIIGAGRYVKMPRFIPAGLAVNKIISMWNGDDATGGLYERFEGFSDFKKEGRRGTGGKLYQWTNQSFTGSSVEKEQANAKKKSLLGRLNSALGDPVGQVTRQVINHVEHTINGFLGTRIIIGDPPTRYVDSDKSLGSKEQLTKYTSRLEGIIERFNKNKTGVEGHTVSTDYQDRIDDKAYYKPGLSDKQYDSTLSPTDTEDTVFAADEKRIQGIGDQGNRVKLSSETQISKFTKRKIYDDKLVKNTLGDKVNLFPYGDVKDEDKIPEDLVNFRIKDLVANKYLIFRAILTGVSDSLAPEWGSEKFIGRAENVWIYKGNNRLVNFSFTLYPKTEQELPVLMEKLNYMIGLTYPQYESHTQRMIGPFIELTLGDLLRKQPGFLESFSYQVEDNSTWETAKGMQFPKYITTTVGFRYIGNVHANKYGKHIGIDNGKIWNEGANPIDYSSNPRTNDYTKFITNEAVKQTP